MVVFFFPRRRRGLVRWRPRQSDRCFATRMAVMRQITVRQRDGASERFRPSRGWESKLMSLTRYAVCVHLRGVQQSVEGPEGVKS